VWCLISEVRASEEVAVERSKERVKRKATAPNPLATQAPSEDSKNSKKRKIGKFRS
jgi:hypothetical protein